MEGPVITEPAQVASPRPAGPGARRPDAPRARPASTTSVAHSDLPVSFTDNQGPLNIALNLVGLERLIVWMVDEPVGGPRAHGLLHDRAHRLGAAPEGPRRRAATAAPSHTSSRCRTTSAACGSPTTTAPSSRRGSTASSSCPTTVASSRPSAAARCTTAAMAGHQLENYLATDGLVGVNVWCMGEFEQVFRAQRIFRERVVLMVCDYTPAGARGLLPPTSSRGSIRGARSWPPTRRLDRAPLSGAGQVEAVRRAMRRARAGEPGRSCSASRRRAAAR